jgi:hypothetical protein
MNLSAAIAPASAWRGHALKLGYYSRLSPVCQLIFAAVEKYFLKRPVQLKNAQKHKIGASCLLTI